ncbi:acetylornithine deacetylase/succinyl-diaminopimelate desuccinylase-like protein [Microbacteriaceae bacterium MWH-Ta3]|nr:acetylornithine deacetylase/succinyl-diaminopimelate desuccinylase-like protein [Microbacteriaceae bacterium MWH-Ta3]
MTDSLRSLDSLRDATAAAFPGALDELMQLVRIPSVSWDGFDLTHVAATAQHVHARLSASPLFARGGDNEGVWIVREPASDSQGGGDTAMGREAVIARRNAAPGYPTVMLYAHHDVQPEGDLELWDSNPFDPEIRDGRLYGRGAADDKAGVMVHLTALDTLAAVTAGNPNIGIVVFIEGEEEFGSKSFPQILSRWRDRLAADVIVVADSDNRSVDIPSLTVSLRGNVTCTLTVSTLAHASHSGMLGGAVPDGMMAAVRLLDSFYTADGSVAIAGLHRHEAPVPDFTLDELQHDSGLLPGVSDIGSGPILSRLWFQPSLTVTGIDAPTVMNASNTVLPSVRVKVSMRVAPGQTAQAAFEALSAHIAAHTPWGAHVDIADVDLGNPFLVDASGSAAALELEALRDAWDGADPVCAGVGGSIPFIAQLNSVFPDAQILVTGVEDPESRAHSPNESLSLVVFHRAILAETLLLSRLDERGE